MSASSPTVRRVLARRTQWRWVPAAWLPRVGAQGSAWCAVPPSVFTTSPPPGHWDGPRGRRGRGDHSHLTEGSWPEVRVSLSGPALLERIGLHTHLLGSCGTAPPGWALRLPGMDEGRSLSWRESRPPWERLAGEDCCGWEPCSYLPPPCLRLSSPLGDPASSGGRILSVEENGRLAPGGLWFVSISRAVSWVETEGKCPGVGTRRVRGPFGGRGLRGEARAQVRFPLGKAPRSLPAPSGSPLHHLEPGSRPP